MTQQVAHAFLRPADDVGQWKNHLDAWVLFAGMRRNSSTARCFSIWYCLFIVTLSFSLGIKTNRRPSHGRQFESRYFFYELPGILPNRAMRDQIDEDNNMALAQKVAILEYRLDSPREGM